MPDTIRDGTGRGYLVGVSSENKLLTSATTTTLAHHTNHIHSEAYSLQFNKTPTAAGDCFLYIKNTNPNYPIIVSQIILWSASAEKVTVSLNDSGTAAGGTDIVPCNMSAGSATVAVGTFQEGVDITGLSGGTVCSAYRLVADVGSKIFDVESDIIIPVNKTLKMCAITGAIEIDGSISFWYDHGGEE